MKRYLPYLLVLLIFPILSANGYCKGNFYVSVSCDKTAYATGDPIAMAVTVLNKNGASLKVNFTSSQRYDFCLYREKELVWKWSRDMMFAQALSSMVLQPQKPVTFVVVFNQVLPSGKLLEPGKYNLVGSFVTKETSYSSESMEITIH